MYIIIIIISVLIGAFIFFFLLQIDSKRRRVESFESLLPLNGRYFNIVQIIARLFPFTVHKYIYPPVSKVHAGFCVCFRNPSNSDMDYTRIFNVRT